MLQKNRTNEECQLGQLGVQLMLLLFQMGNHIPVTHRSTLVVKNRLDPTAGRRRTRLRASVGLPTRLTSNASRDSWRLVNLKVFRGILPNTFSRSRSTGGCDSAGACLSSSVIFPLPLILPRTCSNGSVGTKLPSPFPFF